MTIEEITNDERSRAAYAAMIQREFEQGLCDVNGRWIKNGNHN